MAELADTLCSGCVTIGFYFDWSGFSLLISTLQGFLGKFQPSKKSGILIRGCVGTGRRAGFGSRHDREFILIETSFPFLYNPQGFLGDFSRVKNLKSIYAGVLELADELASGASVRKDVWVQIPPPAPTNIDKKDIMPTNGSAKPFVGINLAKNRIHDPQIFSTQKWT